MPSLLRTAGATACLAILVAGCGQKPAPSAPTQTVTQVQVGVSGNTPAVVIPGETKQLFATAMSATGTTTDVTNLATWQSSNPSLATVSPAGLLTAAAEGAVDVSATYSSVRGSLHVDLRRPNCDLGLTPPTASFTPFGGELQVDVTAPAAECRWTARSTAAWFPFVHDPGRSGSGSFRYTLPANTTPDTRTATIVVEPQFGAAATHTLSQGRPGCSYVTTPAEATYAAAGGTGFFDVVATPSTCQWTASSTMTALGVSITSGFGAIGNARVRYSVQAHVRTVDADGYIEIAGLSGLNPNGRHHVIVLKRQ